MIDSDGFRPNVGIIVANTCGQVLWARRAGQNAWQFPQGGIKADESPEQALFRELNENHGATFLIATHDERVMRYAKRLIKMQDGRIIEDAPQVPA